MLARKEVVSIFVKSVKLLVGETLVVNSAENEISEDLEVWKGVKKRFENSENQKV